MGREILCRGSLPLLLALVLVSCARPTRGEGGPSPGPSSAPSSPQAALLPGAIPAPGPNLPRARGTPGRRALPSPSPVGCLLPQPGTWLYASDGWEEGEKGPIKERRALPAEHTLVVSTWERRAGGCEATLERRYSQDHTESGRFLAGPGGVYLTYSRVFAKYGPVSRTEESTPSPPVLVTPDPPEVGRSWRSEFTGKESGVLEGWRWWEHRTRGGARSPRP